MWFVFQKMFGFRVVGFKMLPGLPWPSYSTIYGQPPWRLFHHGDEEKESENYLSHLNFNLIWISISCLAMAWWNPEFRGFCNLLRVTHRTWRVWNHQRLTDNSTARFLPWKSRFIVAVNSKDLIKPAPVKGVVAWVFIYCSSGFFAWRLPRTG